MIKIHSAFIRPYCDSFWSEHLWNVHNIYQTEAKRNCCQNLCMIFFLSLFVAIPFCNHHHRHSFTFRKWVIKNDLSVLWQKICMEKNTWTSGNSNRVKKFLHRIVSYIAFGEKIQYFPMMNSTVTASPSYSDWITNLENFKTYKTEVWTESNGKLFNRMLFYAFEKELLGILHSKKRRLSCPFCDHSSQWPIHKLITRTWYDIQTITNRKIERSSSLLTKSYSWFKTLKIVNDDIKVFVFRLWTSRSNIFEQ